MPAHREPEREFVADHAGRDESTADAGGALSGRDLDELFAGETPEGRGDMASDPQGRAGRGQHDDDEQEQGETLHAERGPWPGVEIFLQQHRGRGRIEARLAATPVGLALGQERLGLDAGQSLVERHDRHGHPARQAFDEIEGLGREVGGGPVEPVRHADDNRRQRRVFGLHAADHVEQRRPLCLERRPLHDLERSRQRAGCIADGDTGSPGAEIEGQHAHRHRVTRPDGRAGSPSPAHQLASTNAERRTLERRAIGSALALCVDASLDR